MSEMTKTLSFSSNYQTRVLGVYQGVNNGVQEKFIDYQEAKSVDFSAFVRCHKKTTSIHGKVISDRVAIFNRDGNLWFCLLSRELTVGRSVPGSDKFLDTLAGIFMPMRCLIELKNGRPVDVDGFIPSLKHWTDQTWIQSKASALAKFDSKDEAGLLVWRTVVEKGSKAGTKDSFYMVRADPQKKQIISWDYHEAGVLKETWAALTWQEVDGMKVLQNSEMTHYVEGKAFSQSKIEVANVRFNFEPDMSVFEIDPAEAESIYDRDTKTLIKVPK